MAVAVVRAHLVSLFRRRRGFRVAAQLVAAFAALLLLPLAPSARAALDLSDRNTPSGTAYTLQTDYPGDSDFHLPDGGTISAGGSGVAGNDAQDWSFFNEGTINAGQNGGTGSGIMFGSLTEGAAQVKNSGTIGSATNRGNGPSGIQFSNGGRVVNNTGAFVSGFDGVHADGGPLFVDNAGTIRGAFSGGTAIYLGAGGTITNRTGASITGTSYGINSNAFSGNVTIFNYGTINTNDQAVKLYNGNVYAILNDTDAVIQSGGGATVDLGGATGYLLNKGTITAQNIGVRSNSGDGRSVYVNAGVITATNGPAVQTEAADAGNVIYNLGTARTDKAGGDAILIKGGNTRLVLGTTAYLPQLGQTVTGTGSVLNGNARSTGANNDVELTDSGLGTEDAQKLIGFRNLIMNGMDWSLDNSLVLNGGLRVEQGNLSINGPGTFGGGISKSGTGTLTLAGVNSYTGPTTLSGGTLALVGAGTLGNTSKLSMLGGTTFDFSGMIAPSITLPRLEVLGQGAAFNAGPGMVDVSGGVLAFNLSGAGPGDTMLFADNGLVLSGATRVILFNAPALTLPGQRVTLADDLNPAAAFTDRQALVDFKKYFLGLDGDDLIMSLLGASSYRLEEELFFDPRRLNNSNLRNGSDQLDRLAALVSAGAFDPERMSLLDAAFFDSLALGGGAAARSLEQVFGGYAAYARDAVRLTGDRFADLWRGRNRLFLDRLAPGCVPVVVAASDPESSFASGRRGDGAAGSGVFWASGFGGTAEQDGAGNLSGYRYDTWGAAVGYEHILSPGFRLGLAAGWSRGDFRVDDLSWRNRPDILNVALYGVYAHESGLYAQGGVGYGHAWNDYDVDMLLGGRKSGRYGADNWSVDLELGYALRLPRDVMLIPSLGLEYDYLRNEGWEERVHGNSGLVAGRFEDEDDDSLAVPFNLRLNKRFCFDEGNGFITPELRAAWVWQADAAGPRIDAGYVGAPGTAVMRGVDPDDNHWRLGAGLSGKVNDLLEFRADYDFQTASGYRGHSVTASVGIEF